MGKENRQSSKQTESILREKKKSLTLKFNKGIHILNMGWLAHSMNLER